VGITAGLHGVRIEDGKVGYCRCLVEGALARKLNTSLAV